VRGGDHSSNEGWGSGRGWWMYGRGLREEGGRKANDNLILGDRRRPPSPRYSCGCKIKGWTGMRKPVNSIVRTFTNSFANIFERVVLNFLAARL